MARERLCPGIPGKRGRARDGSRDPNSPDPPSGATRSRPGRARRPGPTPRSVDTRETTWRPSPRYPSARPLAGGATRGAMTAARGSFQLHSSLDAPQRLGCGPPPALHEQQRHQRPEDPPQLRHRLSLDSCVCGSSSRFYNVSTGRCVKKIRRRTRPAIRGSGRGCDLCDSHLLGRHEGRGGLAEAARAGRAEAARDRPSRGGPEGRGSRAAPGDRPGRRSGRRTIVRGPE